MVYSEKRFEGAFARIAECSWLLETASRTRTVFPDGCADLFLTGTGEAYIAGSAQLPRSLGPQFSGVLQGVRFQPGAIARILQIPAYELTDCIVPIVEIPSVAAKRIAVTVRCADGADQALRFLCAALNRHAIEYDGVSARMFDYVLPRLQTKTVAQLSSDIGVTERHLHRLFLHHIGISPMRMRRIRRFQTALDAMRRWNSKSSLARCALACGFSDQAHFNREIREFAGTTPARLLVGLRST